MTTPRRSRFDLVLFDIDGTLCDPGTGITDAVQHALAELGIKESDETALRRFVGPPLELSFRDYYGLGPQQVGAAVAAYRHRYAGHGMRQYRAYLGIPELLKGLTAAGAVLGVVTAKIQPFAEQALHNTGLLSHFATIHGRAADEVVTKTVTLHQALAAHPDRRRAVLVGDREHDAHAAADNGIDSLGVLWGYGTRAELTAAGATQVAASPEEALARLLKA